MRLNPQVIMVRAALHAGRKAFTQANPGLFGDIERQVMARGDDAMSQLAYFLYTNHGKQRMPSLLKRALSDKLGSLNAYEAAKYKRTQSALPMPIPPSSMNLWLQAPFDCRSRRKPGRICAPRVGSGGIFSMRFPWDIWLCCGICEGCSPRRKIWISAENIWSD